MRSVGRSPRARRIESTEPMGIERDRWASREVEVSGSERVNHSCPTDLILYVIHVYHSRMAYGTLPDHVRHQRFAAGAFPRRLRAWRERNNLSQSEAALKLQISKRTLQEWEQDRAAPRGFARTAIEKAIRA